MKKRITIIKICDKDYLITKEDIEHWKAVFGNRKIDNPDKYNVMSDGQILVENVEINDEEHTVTFVKVGSLDYYPTASELENWRDLFEEAMHDPDFKIFTHPWVEIKQIKIDEIVAVE